MQDFVKTLLSMDLLDVQRSKTFFRLNEKTTKYIVFNRSGFTVYGT
jgi:hypothetical protein